MKNLMRVLVFAGLPAVTFPQATQPTKAVQSYVVPEAYEVYSAILPAQWTWHDAKASNLVIRAETVTYEMCLKPDNDSREILDAAIADFVKMNRTALVLQRLLTLTSPMNWSIRKL